MQETQETAGLISELGRFPGEGNGNPLQCLTWEILWTEEPGGLHTVHGVAKSQTRLSTHTYTYVYVCVYMYVHTHRSMWFIKNFLGSSLSYSEPGTTFVSSRA